MSYYSIDRWEVIKINRTLLLLFIIIYLFLFYFIFIFNTVLKEGNVLLTMHSTHFIYGYMASDIW